MVTRREFIGGAAVSAAAVVLGIKPGKSVDTKLGMYFFGPDPMTFDARLRTEEISDLLTMEIVHQKGGVVAHFPLSAVRKAVEEPGTPVPAVVRIWKDGILGELAEKTEIEIVAHRNLLSLRASKEEGAPVWLPVEDVRRVL